MTIKNVSRQCHLSQGGAKLLLVKNHWSKGIKGLKSQLSPLLAMKTWACYLPLGHQFFQLQKGCNGNDNNNMLLPLKIMGRVRRINACFQSSAWNRIRAEQVLAVLPGQTPFLSLSPSLMQTHHSNGKPCGARLPNCTNHDF